ncbi:TPA: hypothetical protein GXZ54_07705 [bacterium]|nr:hypothetical protein [bacterium]
MDLRSSVNGNKIFSKDDNILLVPSKFNDDEIQNIFFEYLASAKSLDYEFRSYLKDKLQQETISTTLYETYYKANVNYDIELEVKLNSGVNVEIIKSNLSKLISSNFPALTNKSDETFNESKQEVSLRIQNASIKEYYQDPSIKEIVSVYEQNDQLEVVNVSNLRVIGLTLNKYQLLKRVKKDIIKQVKQIIKNNFHSYDYKITKVKLSNFKFNQITYVLIPYTRYLIDAKYYVLINRVNGKVYLDYSNLNLSGEVKFRMLELMNYDKFNTNMMFLFFALLVSSVLFYPLMWVTRLIEIDLNIFLGLGISFAIGIIFGFYRSLKYSLANKLSLQEMARIYEKGEYEVIRSKKRDRKFMLITGNIVMAVIAVILIVLTFTNFNS